MKRRSAKRGPGSAGPKATERTRGLRRRWWLPSLLLLLVLAFATGCGGDDEEGNGGGSAGESGSSEFAGTITIGVNAELSGPAVLLGRSRLPGYETAIAEINDGGGVQVGGEAYELQMVPCDNRSEPTQGIVCARRLLEEDTFVQLTPDSGFDAAYRILTDNDVPIVTTASGTATILLGEDPDAHPSLFFDGITFDRLVESYFSQVKALRPEVETMAALLPDDENGAGFDQLFKAAAEEGGIEYLGAEFHPPDQTGDFSSYLTSLREKDPDLLYLTFFPQVAVPAAEQAAELDVAPIFGSHNLLPRDFAEADLGGHEMILQATNLTNVSIDGLPEADADAFERIDTAADGEEYTSPVSATAYQSTQLLKAAIEEAGSLDPEAVRTALLTATYEGALGPVTIVENHGFEGPMSTFVWDQEGNVSEAIFESPFAREPRETIEVTQGGAGE